MSYGLCMELSFPHELQLRADHKKACPGYDLVQVSLCHAWSHADSYFVSSSLCEYGICCDMAIVVLLSHCLTSFNTIKGIILHLKYVSRHENETNVSTIFKKNGIFSKL